MSTTRSFAFGGALALSAALASSPPAAWARDPTPVTVVDPVTVANPNDLAKAMGVEHPFARTVSCTANQAFVCATTGAQVPASERWAVESVTYQCDFRPGSNLVIVEIDAEVGGRGESLFPAVDHGVDFGDGAQKIAEGGQNLRFYADPSTTVSATFQIGPVSQFAQCQLTIIGQAIDVP